MIKSVTVTNYLGESIVLELGAPEKSGLLIRKIEGLGPVKSNINVTEVATSDGALFNSARRTARNIVMTLQFLECPTIEDARQKTYKYFPEKQKVKLTIETTNRVCETHGYVESNEPDIFSSAEMTPISIICPDPNLYSVGTNTTVFYGVNPNFEFPFSNESLTDALIELGSIESNSRQTVFYKGDVEVGVVIRLHAVGEVTNLSIFNTTSRTIMRLDSDKLATITGSGIIAGDDIVISTVKDNKYIQLIRDGVVYNILNCLDKNTDWFKLRKGDNIFAYTADYGETNVEFCIEHKDAYGGI